MLEPAAWALHCVPSFPDPSPDTMNKLASLLLVALSAPAMAQYTPPLGESPPIGGPRTGMMTLGSVHLSGHREWKQEWLAPLNAKLVAWGPDVVTIERLSGAQCEMMRNTPEKFGEVFGQYCNDDTAFQRALRMTQAQAEARVERMLADWPAEPTPAQRRQLAMLFLAAGDRPSALVQWLRLPEAERREGDGLDKRALEVLARALATPMNENYAIGAAVASARGLERVHSVDDHTADVLQSPDEEAFGAWQMARYGRLRESPLFEAAMAAEAAVVDGPSLLGLYRDMNVAGAQDAQIQGDFGGAIADPVRGAYGRWYGGWWETRNLRMMANVREAITPHPGARVLNIVGASHKPWYDQWARQMADIEVVDAHAVLSTEP